jgi:hypothetical protein
MNFFHSLYARISVKKLKNDTFLKIFVIFTYKMKDEKTIIRIIL